MHYEDGAALRTLLATDPAAFVAAVLRALDLPVTGIARTHGWSNSVWLSAQHVVRLSSGRFRDSLVHEAAVLEVLPEDVPDAQVIAVGKVGQREWMVQKRVPGSTWLDVWPRLSVAERCSATEQLGRALRAWHAMQLPTGLDNPWLADALAPGGHPEDAYHAPPKDYRVLLTAAHRLPAVDHALLDAVGTFIAERLGCPARRSCPR